MYIAQYLARCGVCSRRKAIEHVKDGDVIVNGKVVDEHCKVQEKDVVKFKGKKVFPKDYVYIILNKPKGYITTRSDEQGRKTVLDLIKKSESKIVVPVGRLDCNTTGILLLTNDGALVQKLTHPSNEIKKRYSVNLSKQFDQQDLKRIQKGFVLDDGPIKIDDVSSVQGKNNQVIVDIHCGRPRIVRRIFEYLNYFVNDLDRISFAGLTHKNLPIGKWRFLRRKEIESLKKL
jgi:23S rRNA pseudouridine2605 synthase